MTNATSTRNVTVDMPDFTSSETVTFTLMSFVAIADNSEIFPGKVYTITLDGSGTGNIDLPTPDGDGTASWAWAVKLPDNNVYDVTLAWAAGAVSLATLLAAAVSTTTPNSLTALLASYVLKAGDTMTGALAITDTTTPAAARTLLDLTNNGAVGIGLTDSDADITWDIQTNDDGYLTLLFGDAVRFTLDDSGNIVAVGSLSMVDNLITRPVLKDYGEAVNAIGGTGGGTQDIDLTLGNVVTATVDTSANTFTFSNPPASGTAGSFTLTLTNGGSQTVNWPGSVDWAGGTAPTLTASGVDIITFTTVDAGTIWYGFAAGLDMQ